VKIPDSNSQVVLPGFWGNGKNRGGIFGKQEENGADIFPGKAEDKMNKGELKPLPIPAPPVLLSPPISFKPQCTVIRVTQARRGEDLGSVGGLQQKGGKDGQSG
jgi:hypothetical protein